MVCSAGTLPQCVVTEASLLFVVVGEVGWLHMHTSVFNMHVSV